MPEIECGICFDSHIDILFTPLSPTCKCRICKTCFLEQCKLWAEEDNVSNFVCPVCKPSFGQNYQKMTMYFLYTLSVLKNYKLKAELRGKIAEKMEDHHYKLKDAFRQCSHCKSGIIFVYTDSVKMECSECHNFTCYQCEIEYDDEHDCDAYQDYLAVEIPIIKCPKCENVYERINDGCPHVTCVQKACKHDFCSCCSQPYYKSGRKRQKTKANMMCRHSRNCESTLMCCSVEDLTRIIKKSNIDICLDPSTATSCVFMNVVGIRRSHCGKEVHKSNLCLEHYKSYIINKIQVKEIDPTTYLSVDLMVKIIRKSGKKVPRLNGNANDNRTKLIEIIQKLPICKGKDGWVETVKLVDDRSKSSSIYIDCPSCKSQFVLEAGGCLHMTCSMCKHEFCGECKEPMKRTKEKGLHCQHARNCAANLRDVPLEELLEIAQKNQIDLTDMHSSQRCGVEVSENESCGESCYQSGHCEKHYKQHVIHEINAHNIDPIEILPIQTLKNELTFCNMALPNSVDDEQEYRRILENTVKEKCPLPKIKLTKTKMQKKTLQEIKDDYELYLKEKLKKDPLFEIKVDLPLIECPSCEEKFELVRNFGLDYQCYACENIFCRFCYEVLNSENDHHKRNCWLYLSEWTDENLEQLILVNGLFLDDADETDDQVDNCQMLMEVDELDLDNKILCTEEIYKNLLCLTHYKETLAEVIQTQRLEPLLSPHIRIDDVMEEFARMNVSPPDQEDDVDDEEYKLSLIAMMMSANPI